MGLASSQVRLLTLTSEKLSLEKDIMLNSTQRTSLSNEMMQLAMRKKSMLNKYELQVTSNSGELKEISYQYLMGKIHGVQDIGTKNENGILLFDSHSGRVVVSSEMSAILGSEYSLKSRPDRIYEAIGRLCGATYLAVPDERSYDSSNITDPQFCIGGDLVKAILNGKYDGATITTLNDAIDRYNLKYYEFPNVNTMKDILVTNDDESYFQPFCTVGYTTNDWVGNFNKLISDVKFYFPIVSACAKFGFTTGYDDYLDDNSYVDNGIQNGTFQIMEYDSTNAVLKPEHNADYYLLNTTLWKISSYENEATVQAWYESEKNAIKDKETFLDIQMDNMNTELNSITTEIESIKSIIDDSVSEGFEWASA